MRLDRQDGATEDRCNLCRRGESTNKSFCSGAHWYANFDEVIEQEDNQ